MTFALALAARSSIWACTDRQLTDLQTPSRSGRSGVKVTSIEASDGIALLAYAGVGRVGDTQVSRWAYRALVNRRMPIENCLACINDAARRKLAAHARFANTTHLFIAAAICGDRHYAYELDFESPHCFIRHQPKSSTHVKVIVTGSGALYVDKIVQARIVGIARLVKRFERKQVSSKFLAAQLASLNIEISKRGRSRAPPDERVSAEAVVIYRAKDRTGEQWCFDATGNVCRDPVGVVPTAMGGFPATDIAALCMAEAQRCRDALPADASPEYFYKAVTESEVLRTLPAAQLPHASDEEFR
jgi:hypothetical protein